MPRMAEPADTSQLTFRLSNSIFEWLDENHGRMTAPAPDLVRAVTACCVAVEQGDTRWLRKMAGMAQAYLEQPPTALPPNVAYYERPVALTIIRRWLCIMLEKHPLADGSRAEVQRLAVKVVEWMIFQLVQNIDLGASVLSSLPSEAENDDARRTRAIKRVSHILGEWDRAGGADTVAKSAVKAVLEALGYRKDIWSAERKKKQRAKHSIKRSAAVRTPKQKPSTTGPVTRLSRLRTEPKARQKSSS